MVANDNAINLTPHGFEVFASKLAPTGRDVRTIGTPIYRGNRQSLIAKSVRVSTIGS